MIEKEKLVLFLGTADREGVTARLQAKGTKYKRKMLESSIENWKEIISLFDENEISSVVVKLTKTTFSILCSQSHAEVADILLQKISQKPNIFLAHESLITGVRSKYYEEKIKEIDDRTQEDYDPAFEDDMEHLRHHYSDLFEPPKEWMRRKVIEILESKNIDLIPYEKNVELSLIASSFLDQTENHLIFRIYVPSEKMWANEAEKLLNLFSDYLRKISGLEVKQEQYRASQGIVYEFFGEADFTHPMLAEKFDEFSNFMDVCTTNPEQATALLQSKNLNTIEVIKLVERYCKEAKRLHIDLKQERELKLLTIRHQLESELVEYIRTPHDWDIVSRIVNSAVPQLHSIGAIISANQGSSPTNQTLTVNINPQIIGTINGVVAQQVVGEQHLGPDAKKLLEIIDQYAESRRTELTSALHELADKGIKEPDRITAKHKLKGFLLSVGSKIGDVTAGVLQSYIENQIGL